MRRRLSLICLALLLFVAAGCKDRSEPINYTEPIPEAASMMAEHGPDDGHNHAVQEKQLAWTLPSGWIESKASGMIMSKITVPEVSGALITLVQLGGTGGGMNPNIQRWAGQLGLPQLSDAELITVKQTFEHDAAKATFIDFNVLSSVKEASMKVCVLEYPDFTLFLKVKGPKEAIAALSDEFLSLAQSISYK